MECIICCIFTSVLISYPKEKIFNTFFLIVNYLTEEFFAALGRFKTPGLAHIFVSFFLLISCINFFLSHLVPLGTPVALIPLIVVIEIVRRLIRPITLSVRLAANIVAGHLLIALIRGPLSAVRFFRFFLILGGLLLLTLLELAVSFIQAYVFSTLISLYIIEVNSPNF